MTMKLLLLLVCIVSWPCCWLGARGFVHGYGALGHAGHCVHPLVAVGGFHGCWLSFGRGCGCWWHWWCVVLVGWMWDHMQMIACDEYMVTFSKVVVSCLAMFLANVITNSSSKPIHLHPSHPLHLFDGEIDGRYYMTHNLFLVCVLLSRGGH